MRIFESRVEDYDLPDSWSSGRLDEVCEQMKQGRILPQKEIHKIGKHPVYGANGCIGYCDKYFLNEERILITCRGSTCGTINRSPKKSFVTNNAMILFERNFLDKSFLFFALQEFSTKRLKTGSGQPQLTKGILNSHIIPLPPLREQKKIAHVLTIMQHAIEAQKRIIQTTTELKNTLMHKLFTEGLRNEPQKQTEIGLIPESWNVVEIAGLGECVTGSTPKTNVAAYYSPPSEDFIAPADLGMQRYVYNSEKKISPQGMITIRAIPKNAVMCVCIGSSIGKVGMTFREISATNQQINSIVCNEACDPEFVFYLLSYFRDYWKGFATPGPVPILSKGRFSSIVVPLPKLIEDQKNIVRPLLALDLRIEISEKKSATLNDLFRTVLHDLMTAKIRVHELNILGALF